MKKISASWMPSKKKDGFLIALNRAARRIIQSNQKLPQIPYPILMPKKGKWVLK